MRVNTGDMKNIRRSIMACAGKNYAVSKWGRRASPNVLEHGADIVKVQEWLGHVNVSTTRSTIAAKLGRKIPRHFGFGTEGWLRHDRSVDRPADGSSCIDLSLCCL